MRIAIIGGTFDPIHNGHLAAAESVAAAFQVDEVHFIPAYCPPHKQLQAVTSSFHRFAMVALATMPFERFRASSLEVDSMEKRYSVDTLQAMNHAYPGADLLFVVGTDMYREIDTWKDYRRLFELAHMVVVNRPGFEFRKDVAPFRTLTQNEAVDLATGKLVFYLPFVEQPVSSTEIRAGIAKTRLGSEGVRACLPPQVWRYIEKNRLYS